MATVLWGAEIASVYDISSAEMFEPEVLGPTVDVLASLAGHGAALEFAVGTGRVALPLSERGVPVAGIELSPHMAAVLRAKPGASAVPVTIGDMASLDLMARIAGLRLEHRWAGWDKAPYTGTSTTQVAVYRKAP